MITFFSDPHIGLKRTANTTPHSRSLLRTNIFQQAMNIVAESTGVVVCGGDLFDSYSNSENDILAGFNLAGMCDVILGGNHDVVQDATKIGSLGLISRMLNTQASRIVMPAFNEVVVESVYQELGPRGANLTLIPHHTTQDLFDEALCSADSYIIEDLTNILLLHCNYESPHELTETSMNLSEQQAKELLEDFDYILIGHEHNPRDLFDGRLKIIGNTFPTSFSDISDKRILIFEDGEFRNEWVWREDHHVINMDCHNILTEPLEDIQFVDITGKAEHGQLASLAKSIGEVWRHNPQMLAIRSKVDVTGLREAVKRGSTDMRSLPQLIEAELAEHPEKLDLWHEARGAQS